MHENPRKLAAPLRALLAVAAVLLALAVCPAAARADEASDALAYADVNGTRTYYNSVSDAINAAYSGATIVMTDDWALSDSKGIELKEGSSVTIDMNGHFIQQRAGEGKGIKLNDNCKLTLKTSSASTFNYWGYDANYDKWGTFDNLVQAFSSNTKYGALFDGVSSGDGAIVMEDGCTLTLDGVGIAGNSCKAGGIYVNGDHCTINMTGSYIEHNKGSVAGGIYVNDDHCTINMTHSHITGNYSEENGGGIHVNDGDCTINMNTDAHVGNNHAAKNGGGIYSNKDATRINMEGSPSIARNWAKTGGGIYFENSYFGIQSNDKTGLIEYNRAEDGDGGGVYVNSARYTTHCSIRGVNINCNSASVDGGGVYLNQDKTHLIDCKINWNKAADDGGGVYVNNSGCSIQGCEITENQCCTHVANNAEGGGVFVSYKYDLELTGKCTIKSNCRLSSDVDDDLFLSTITGETGYAYITGGVDAGSEVGIRTGIEGKDRKLGKDITTYTDGTYFMDDGDYYVTGGSGEVWQRMKVRSTVYVNGSSSGTHNQGDTVTASGASGDSGKHFWYWDASSTTGLSNVADVINAGTMYNESLTFTMPTNDVKLAAVYADCVTKLLVGLEKPVAGEELPAYATLRRTDGGAGGQYQVVDIPVTWYKLDADGNEVLVATGKAEYGAAYVAELGVDPESGSGLFFSKRLSAADVTVRTSSDGAGDAPALSAKVNSAGRLSVQAGRYTTASRPRYTITVDRPVIGREPSSTATVSWDGGQKTGEVTIWWLDRWGNIVRTASAGEQYRFVVNSYGDGLDLPADLTADDFEVRYADAPDAGPFPVQDAHVTSDSEFDVTYLNVTSEWIDSVTGSAEGGDGDDVLPGGGTNAAGETGDGSGTEAGTPKTGDAAGNVAPLAMVGASLLLAVGVVTRRLRE